MTSSFMASMSEEYAARQKAVDPVSSMPDWSKSYCEYQTFLVSRALGFAPFCSSVSIISPFS